MEVKVEFEENLNKMICIFFLMSKFATIIKEIFLWGICQWRFFYPSLTIFYMDPFIEKVFQRRKLFFLFWQKKRGRSAPRLDNKIVCFFDMYLSSTEKFGQLSICLSFENLLTLKKINKWVWSFSKVLGKKNIRFGFEVFFLFRFLFSEKKYSDNKNLDLIKFQFFFFAIRTFENDRTHILFQSEQICNDNSENYFLEELFWRLLSRPLTVFLLHLEISRENDVLGFWEKEKYWTT